MVAGPNSLELVRVNGGDAEAEDLLAYFPEGPGFECEASTAVTVDIDADGLLDLYIACRQALTADGRSRMRNNVWLRQLPTGVLERGDQEILGEAGDAGNTLAVGVLDVDDDGLLDFVLANDTFSRPYRRNLFDLPGGFYFRCSPLDDCAFSVERVQHDNSAWGSFMGVAVIDRHEHGERLVLSDWGPRRFIDFQSPELTDEAELVGVAFPRNEVDFNFSWGIVVDDFDGNGLDDFLVGQGSPVIAPTFAHFHHDDLLFLQRPGGWFAEVATVYGIAPNRSEDSLSDERDYSTRSILRADLDLDGGLELVTSGLEGLPRVYTESPTFSDGSIRRCTISARPRYAKTLGLGFRTLSDGDRTWRRREVHGQPWGGPSPWLSVAHGSGIVRFPSGYEAPYTCDETMFVEVTEPPWIVVTRPDDVSVEVAIERQFDSVAFVARDAAGNILSTDIQPMAAPTEGARRARGDFRRSCGDNATHRRSVGLAVVPARSGRT